MPPSEHDGHRLRMRERYAKGGLDGFAPHEVLELLLFTAIPRRNVNPLAHQLIDHFGTLGAVLEASPKELMQVPGIGLQSATLISMVLPLARYAQQEKDQARAIITNLGEAKAYCRHLFAGKTDEVLYLVCIDAQGRVLHTEQVIRGTIDELTIYPRTIAEIALRHKAYSVVLAHNHPSGVAEPSPADIQSTDFLREVLSGVGIRLYDHLIFADGECTSVAQSQRQQQMRPTLYKEKTAPKAADTKQGPKRKPTAKP